MKTFDPLSSEVIPKIIKKHYVFTQNDNVRKGISYSENGVEIPRSNDDFYDYGKVTPKSSQNLIKL